MSGKTISPQYQDWARDIITLSLFFCLIFFSFLGARPLFTPDEGRYAEIGREMVARGDYITPYLNGIKYFEKPVLFYWLGAAAIKLGGVNIFAVRCINAVIGLLGCLLTYVTGRILHGRAAGLIASLVLATSTLYFIMAHMVSLDLPVTVFIAASLYGFLLAAISKNKKHCQRYLYAAAVAAALAVLTKGLIGVVLPGLIAGTWVILLGEWRQLTRLPTLSALLLFFVIAAPWHFLVNYNNPEFFHFYFIEQHFLRYTTLDIGHYQPVWFFIPTLLAGYFPWIVFLPQTFAVSIPRRWQDRAKFNTELFLVIWVVIIFAFFSFSKSNLIPYILPVVPALALLTGRYLAITLQKATRGLIAGYAFLLLLAVGLAYALWHLTIIMTNPALAAIYLHAATVPLVAGAIISIILVKRRPRAALFTTTLSAALFITTFHAAIRYVDTRTVQPLATIIKSISQPGDEVITYNQYYQDLPFYLEQKITILNWRNELTFGMQHQNTQDWMIGNDQFWQRWHTKKHIFMIMSKEQYQLFREDYPHETIILISETATNALVTNTLLAITPS
jgi:4-amino-4-deoxy-L-arabinose transferase-like glycosyltransferase